MIKFKNLHRTICVLLSCLTAFLLPVNAMAVEYQSENGNDYGSEFSSSLSEENKESKILFEILQGRDENCKQFMLEDNSIMLV